jgi:hypothetical protein
VETQPPSRPEPRHRWLREHKALLAVSPHVGTPYTEAGFENVRRRQIKKTPYLVYFVPNDETRTVYIVSVWSGMVDDNPQFPRDLKPHSGS